MSVPRADVAIKVLPEAVTQDAERLARFETEAKAVANQRVGTDIPIEG